MKVHLLFFFFAISVSSLSAQNCDIFYDDYSDAPLWNQVGSDVQVSNNRVEYINDCTGDEQRRVFRSLGTTLNNTEVWSAEIDVYVGFINTGFGTFHNILTLSDSNLEPGNDCFDIDCTGYPEGSQDYIGVYMVTSTYTSNDRSFAIYAEEGTEFIDHRSDRIDAPGLGSFYYIRMERKSATEVELSIFSDAARTLHLPNSPVSLNIPGSITGLQYIQHGGSARGAVERNFNGWVDNTCISSKLFSNTQLAELDQEVSISPNPTNDIVLIEGLDNADVTISIYDGIGALVQQHSTNQQQLDLSSFSNGMYHIVINTEFGQLHRKVIKY